ncbi:hypothetical protein FPV67DRAFT_897889 [Lyophyllum atratum]|nr:hypothetical protein FPV67DRAFT_897889 [Lyophyllum atratum]
MSDLRTRIGGWQAPSTFDHGFIKKPEQQRSESGSHPAITTPPKSRLGRPMHGTPAASHRHLLHANPHPLDPREAKGANPALAPAIPTCTPETKQKMAPKTVNMTVSNASVEEGIEEPVGALAISTNQLPSNNGFWATPVNHGPAEDAYISRSSDSRVSSTASTPKRHSSETVVDMALPHVLGTSTASTLPEKSSEMQTGARKFTLAQPPVLRDALLPVVMQNAQRRPNFGDIGGAEEVRDKLREALNDEFCESLVGKLRSIQEQLQAIRSREADSGRRAEDRPVTPLPHRAGLGDLLKQSGLSHAQVPTLSSATSMSVRPGYEMNGVSIPIPPSPAPLLEPPKAPRAMRLLGQKSQELTQGSPVFLEKPRPRSRSKGVVSENEDPRGRTRWHRGPPSVRSSSSVQTHRDTNNDTFGISIPMDPSFFTTSSTSTTVREMGSPNLHKRRRSVSRPPRSPFRPHSTQLSAYDLDHSLRPAEGDRPPPRYRSPPAVRHDPFSRPSRSTVDRRQVTRSPPPKRRRSPSPRSRSPRRYRSRSRLPHSPSRRSYSPPIKRRRHSLSKPRSPPRPDRTIYRSRRSLSRRSSSPPFRKTPVHLRTISRTFRSPSPHQRSPFPQYRRSPSSRTRSPPPHGRPSPAPRAPSAQHLKRRSRSPRLINIKHHVRQSPSPPPPSGQRRELQSSSTPFGPTPPPRAFRPRLSHAPDGYHPELSKLELSEVQTISPPATPQLTRPPPPLTIDPSQTVDSFTHPDSLHASTLILNHDRTQPPTPADVAMIKPEPDLENFASALHTSFSAVSQEPVLESSVPILDPAPFAVPQEPPNPTLPCHSVPGLWLVKMGHNDADVLDCEFEVDAETAQKWNLLGSSISWDSAAKVSLRLLCLPKDVVQAIYEPSFTSATAEDMAMELSKLKPEWPPQGSLVVQVNPTERHGRSWLPLEMYPRSPALDLTDFIREGRNVIKLIQLTDMADKMFVLHAMPSSADNEELAPYPPTYWDIAAFDRPHQPVDSWSIPSVTIEVM